MIQKRSGTRRRLIVLGSVGGSIADLARGLWRSDSGKRWLAAAGRLPLPVRPHPDPGDDRRSPGAVHLRHLLNGWMRSGSCWPAARAAVHSPPTGRATAAPPASTLRTASRISACPAASAPRRSAASTSARRFLATDRATRLQALQARAERNAFARLLERAIPGDARIVDAGCGTGQMCLYLARADRVVIGADLTRASLRLGAEAARRFGLDRVQFVETDLRRPGVRAGAFDVVLVVRRAPPHAGPARRIRPAGHAGPPGRHDRARALQRRRPRCRCASGAWSRGSRDSR